MPPKYPPVRALCLHGHFYQPPREHPWLGVVGPEASAAPDRDWNTRITRECYAPNAEARVLDGAGRLCDLVNCYEWTSFDFGPTLLSWLEPHAPEVFAALRRADVASQARTGHGNAWASAYGHPILPLSTPRDVRTQVRWGRRDFEHRFGRAPEGMWLPEMAVDRTALAALAEAGITLTLLAPHQARRIRPLGADDAAWTPVTPESLDVSRLYRCLLPGGGFVDVLFRHAALSHGVAFGALLGDGVELAKRLRAALDDDGSIVAIAVDGETYGHHHRFGEMALAAALRVLRRDREVELVGPAAFRDAHPPAHEVEIIEGTSWSCPHGVERWRADCGCRVAGPAGGSQAWRAPLRQAIDWLRNETAILYETRAGEVLHDPCGARDRYVECVLDPGRTAGFLADEANGRLSPAATVLTRRALELARHALLMQTSCGWFFDDLAGLEPVQVMRYAARTIELAEALGVAASGALLAVLGQPPRVPGYELGFSAAPAGGELEAEVRVAELATGALSALRVVAVRAADGTPSCQVGDSRFTLASLFGVQREHLVEAVAREGASVARASRHGALARLRTILEPLLAADTPLPLELAMLLGYEAAEEIAAGVAATPPALGPLQSRAASLRARGVVFPARWLARRLAQALEERIVGLPEGAQEALGLLDLAEAAAVVLDLGPAQVRALAWWREAPPAVRSALPVTRLCERLRIAPEAPGAAAR
ncbi:MAG: DUF3536 domain-containing protein [Deltaproteobacteria bacterium]|nr:MAG: DUF3536 domain-containing protein [Deltaproteobacteria bacterium]